MESSHFATVAPELAPHLRAGRPNFTGWLNKGSRVTEIVTSAGRTFVWTIGAGLIVLAGLVAAVVHVTFTMP
jgi:hypothetical protein